MPLEPLIYRSRYNNVKESYKNQEILGESKETRIFAVFKKNKSINRSEWNNKIKKNYGSNKLDNYHKKKR